MKWLLSSFSFVTQGGHKTWRHTSPTHNQLVAYYVKLRKDHTILGSSVTVTRATELRQEIQHGPSTVPGLQYSGKLKRI